MKEKIKMNRTRINFFIDFIAFIAFIFLTVTGILVRYVLPHGSGSLQGLGTGAGAAQKPITLLWGLTRHEWGEIHFWVAVTMMAAMAIHLFLHWRWIICVIRGKSREGSGIRLGLGFLGLIVLLALVAAPLISPRVTVTRAELQGTTEIIRRAQDAQTERGENSESSQLKHRLNDRLEDIRGSMTLSEVTRTTGVPVDYIIRQLSLPSNTALDRNLGNLKRTYGFEIEDVRRIIVEYKE